MMLQMRREVARYQQTRVIVQALRDESGDATSEAFKDYRYALMPFLSEEDKREEKKMVQLLHDEVSRGGLKVQALGGAQAEPVSRLHRQRHPVNPSQTANWKRTRRW